MIDHTQFPPCPPNILCECEHISHFSEDGRNRTTHEYAGVSAQKTVRSIAGRMFVCKLCLAHGHILLEIPE